MGTDSVIGKQAFGEIAIDDVFFDSLKADYPGFATWFQKKQSERAFVCYDDHSLLQGFLYTKQEVDPLTDVQPALPALHRLKVGTFKVNAHGTKLGERFMKKIFDIAMELQVKEVYVTIFPKHTGLMNLLTRYGFKKVGTKVVGMEIEDVLSRSMTALGHSAMESYPLVEVTPSTRHYLLAIYPEFHSKLFPDSILNNEDSSIVTDTSSTNSIHKVYLTSIPGIEDLQVGDTLLIYRTADSGKPAEYNSVVTSLCVVEEFRWMSSFKNIDDFLAYTRPFSVFTLAELTKLYQDQRYNRIIRFSYNFALPKRVIRKSLIDDVGMDRGQRWSFVPMSNKEFLNTLQLGEIHAGSIIHTP